MIVNEDAAHSCLGDLGKMGVIQFTDVSLIHLFAARQTYRADASWGTRRKDDGFSGWNEVPVIVENKNIKSGRGGELGVRTLWKIVSVGCSPTRMPNLSLEKFLKFLFSLPCS